MISESGKTGKSELQYYNLVWLGLYTVHVIYSNSLSNYRLLWQLTVLCFLLFVNTNIIDYLSPLFSLSILTCVCP